MGQVRERTFLIAAAVKMPLQLPVTYVQGEIPAGSAFRLDYVLISYFRTEAANAQSSPELFYQLFDSTGYALGAKPTPCFLGTSPGGNGIKGPSVKALVKWGVVYAPLSVVRVELTGMAAGPLPALVSVTFLGMRDRMWV